MPDRQGPFYHCIGEQHQLFPGIDDLDCEACEDACCDEICCTEATCLQPCELLCDTGECLQETHCSPECESPPCFDESCLPVGNVPAPKPVTRKKRKLETLYTSVPPELQAAQANKAFVATTKDITNQLGIHELACFGHTSETCPPGCINPVHLYLQPSLCHHIPPSWTSNQPLSVGYDTSSGHDNQLRSPQQASVASTPYLTHSESRPSTACSVPIDYDDNLFSRRTLECCCVSSNGISCGLTFDDTRSLNQHILENHVTKTRRHNDETEGFYCCWADCSRHLNNQPFSSIGKIESHYLSHSGYRGWKCEFDGCNKIFAREGSLDRHRQTHMDVGTYKCSTCGKAFKDRSQLTIHNRVHTGERPYRCDFPGCSFRASDSTNLTKHKKTHQPRQYHCPYPGCNRSFCRSDGRQRHMKTCKAGKDFEDVLNRSQADWSDLGSTDLRMEKQHNIAQ